MSEVPYFYSHNSLNSISDSLPKEDERLFYIYRHLKPCGEVFYIGQGKKSNKRNRANSKESRSDMWHNVVNKYGYEVQILTTNLTYEQANEIEMALISHYGRRDLKTGTLCNQTAGGEGRKEIIVSEKTRALLAEGTRKAKTGVPKTQEHKDKIAATNRAKNLNPKIKKGNPPRPARKVICIDTFIIFNSISEASRAVNISSQLLGDYFTGELRNKTTLWLLEDYNRNTIPEYKGKDIKVKILDTESGEIYNSIKEAAEKTKINLSTLATCLSGRSKNKTSLIKLKEYINE